VGEPVMAMNNVIHAYAALPASFEAETNPVVEGSRRPDAMVPAGGALRLIRAKVRARTLVAEDIICLDLDHPDGMRLPWWEPGAHVDVHIRPGLVRQYSLTGPVRRDVYRIAVQKEPASTGGSSALHERIAVGDMLTLGEPRNHFELIETGVPVLLLSGGIGMTPILAMAWRLYGLGHQFRWHISARSAARMPFAADLDSWPFRDRITVHLDDGPSDQRLDPASVLRATPVDAEVYVCGPKGYMAFIQDAARRMGVDPKRIHIEHFGAEIDVNGEPFAVVAARSGKRIEVAADRTILQALSDANLHVESSCQNGVCGSCLTPVLEGRPDHRDMVLTDAEKAENNRIAVCCSRSRTRELTLDI